MTSRDFQCKCEHKHAKYSSAWRRRIRFCSFNRTITSTLTKCDRRWIGNAFGMFYLPCIYVLILKHTVTVSQCLELFLWKVSLFLLSPIPFLSIPSKQWFSGGEFSSVFYVVENANTVPPSIIWDFAWNQVNKPKSTFFFHWKPTLVAVHFICMILIIGHMVTMWLKTKWKISTSVSIERTLRWL